MSEEPLRSAASDPEVDLQGPDLTGWADDFVARRARARRAAWARRPKSISKVLAQLITSRGYGRTTADNQLGEVWAAAVGPSLAAVTRVGRLQRGQLEVRVANSTVLQELGFGQRQILANLQKELPSAGLSRIRFRVAPLD